MDWFKEEMQRFTNIYRAGMGLPPLTAATQEKRMAEASAVSATPAPAAAPLGDGVEGAAVARIDPESSLYRSLQHKPSADCFRAYQRARKLFSVRDLDDIFEDWERMEDMLAEREIEK